MNRTACLMVGAAMLVALSSPLLGDMTLPYFENFDSVEVDDTDLDQTWAVAHHGNTPILTGLQAFSGTVSITGSGVNVSPTGFLEDGMQTTEFTAGPVTGNEAGISMMWYKGSHGGAGDDDRVRIDVWDGGSYALTLVIWDGSVLNDSDLSEEPITGLQLDTWYKVELLFNRKLDDSGYLPEATVRVFNADDTLFGSGILTAGKGSRIVPDSISKYDVSFRGNMGIHVDDISIMEGTIIPEPATMSLLAIGAVAVLRRKRR